MLKVRQIKIDALNDNYEVMLNALCKKLNTKKENIISFKISKQSLDARNKGQIFYVYEFIVNIKDEDKYLNNSNDIVLYKEKKYCYPYKNTNYHEQRPLIVGSGPAGLFCAYILAENGYNPIIIEQGEPIEKRIKTVETFWQTGKLNPTSNVQFGEGGAGTFSDGKLNTVVKDDNHRHEKVFDIFIKNGAPDDILYSYKPHIGTDLLSKVIINIRKEIEKMGGTFYFESKLTDIVIKEKQIREIIINNDFHIPCNNLVLALGHSARDTFNILYEKGLQMEGKPFAVGLRVSHAQSMINKSQYGEKYANILESASYKLTYQSSHKRGVYSFCMCPGGYVVNASSKENHLAINGMSNHARNSENANSAIVVTITPDDFGYNALDGVKYQEILEKKAFEIGKGKIPVQLLKDYKKGVISSDFGSVKPLFKGDYSFANLNEIFSDEINNDIKDAMQYFGTKIVGFDKDDTILAAVESRTSSPLKILRNDNYQSNIAGIYPCGEGAGYAGGITSAAIDGIKVAEMVGKQIMSNKKTKD